MDYFGNPSLNWIPWYVVRELKSINLETENVLYFYNKYFEGVYWKA